MASKRAIDRKPKKVGQGGPYIAAAFYCENILEDSKGMISVQGIGDSMHIGLSPFAPPDLPSKENPIIVRHQFLLIFRSGDSPGKHRLKLELESPSGKRTTIKDEEITLTDPPNGGLHIKNGLTIEIQKGGLFWLDVFLDDALMTRAPMNIEIYRPQIVMPEKPDASGGKKKS
jgi:uncharacterized protein DUF6941